MRPRELSEYLHSVVTGNVRLSLMIWGPPGVGKSSIVRQVADRNGLSLTDLRLSQLAPTDLRGLPVADGDRARWLPPEFLPRDGAGILFLDEINMAPPSLQGVAQQLILDRHVGQYRLPDGWFVWAAGNRKEDRAAVFDMPAPLANRFIHLDVEASLEDFRAYGLHRGLDSNLLAFLSFRPELLHKFGAGQMAWPSPRSWEMANTLLTAGLDPAPAVGEGAAAELLAFMEIAKALPDLEQIANGRSQPEFPREPSLRYATVIGLLPHATNAAKAMNAFSWLTGRAAPEWVQLFAVDALPALRAKGQLSKFQSMALERADLKAFLADFASLAA